MTLIEAMKAAGEQGCITRPSFPIYPFGILVEDDCDSSLSITCDLNIQDLEATDWEVADHGCHVCEACHPSYFGELLSDSDFIAEMKKYRLDHEPDGWPAIKQKDLDRLINIIEQHTRAYNRTK